MSALPERADGGRNGMGKDDMKAFGFLITACSVIILAVLAIGAGIGFLLHWMLRSVDLGTAILIGVVTNGFALHFVFRLMSFINDRAFELELDQEEEEEEDIVPRVTYYPLGPN